MTEMWEFKIFCSGLRITNNWNSSDAVLKEAGYKARCIAINIERGEAVKHQVKQEVKYKERGREYVKQEVQQQNKQEFKCKVKKVKQEVNNGLKQ